MWVCLSDSFLSIVEWPDDDGFLLVRARRNGDIEKVFPQAEVRRTTGRDYLFRAVIAREEVADGMAQQAMKISYGNFKNSVLNNALHGAYASFWSIMARLQEVPPYSTARRGTNARQGSFL